MLKALFGTLIMLAFEFMNRVFIVLIGSLLIKLGSKSSFYDRIKSEWVSVTK